MTTPAPTTVEWIRFTVGSSRAQLDATKEWAPRLLVDYGRRDEDDSIADFTDKPRWTKPEMRVTVDLVLLKRTSQWDARAEIHLIHGLLAREHEFSIEAAVTMPGAPYNRVSLPRLTAAPLDVEPITTEAGESALRFIEATAHRVNDGSQYRLTLVD